MGKVPWIFGTISFVRFLPGIPAERSERTREILDLVGSGFVDSSLRLKHHAYVPHTLSRDKRVSPPLQRAQHKPLSSPAYNSEAPSPKTLLVGSGSPKTTDAFPTLPSQIPQKSTSAPLPPSPFPAAKIPKRRKTSVHVTRILKTIRTMMIQVIRVILTSAILSDRISARSRKTRQRSLRTWIRGLISRYSRTAW